MESSDFNGAARYIFDGLRRAVAYGRIIGPVFMSVEMDPSTPGIVTSVVTVSTRQKDMALTLDAHSDAVESISAAMQLLLDHPEVPAALAAYVTPAQVFGGTSDNPKKGWGLCLEVRSVDSTAVTVFRHQQTVEPKSRLVFSPLAFKGLRCA